MKIYTASKVKHAYKWLELRDLGVPIISTWIDEAGEGESSNYAELAIRCILEVAESDVLLLYCESDEILKGALIEVGAALALNKTVICIGHCSSISPVFRKHPLWISGDSIESVIKNLSSK